MIKGDYARELLSIARGAVVMAGKAVLRQGMHKNISSDCGRDVKVEADIRSDDVIVRYLRKRSDFQIVSEESGFINGSGGELTWYVDPLDGSLNYSRGIPICCASVGLFYGRAPVVGAVYDFYRSELYSGIAGIGAWLNGESIRASSINRKEGAVLCTGFPVNTDFSSDGLTCFVKKVQGYKKIRLLGSAALSLAYVASGRADAYMENDIMCWDVAGGLAIAIGAGCLCDIKEGARPQALRVAVSNGNLILD